MILLFLACADEQLAPLKTALDAYTRGKAALDAGHPDEAIEAFAAARKGDPESPVLALWEARARAEGGDVAAAEALATDVLREHPDAGLVWYNRAAWRVRLGHPDAAAEDLRRAITLGAASPYQAAIDPDFLPVLGTEPFAAVLPPTPALIQVVGPAGSVFVGSDVVVEVTMASAPEVGLELERPAATPGCLRLESVVEETHLEAGVQSRRADLHFRAIGPCTFDLALTLRTTTPVDRSIPAAPVAIAVEAPSTWDPSLPEELPTVFPLPGTLATPDGAWAAGRLAEVAWAIGRADEAPTLAGESPPVRLELRVDGTTRAAGGAWPGRPAGPVKAGDWSVEVPAPAPGAPVYTPAPTAPAAPVNPGLDLPKYRPRGPGGAPT